MHWNCPPGKVADDSSFCFIHNTHNIDRICPDCVRRWKWRSGLTSRTPYLQTTNQIVNRETCHGCFVKYKVYFIFLLLDGREAYLKFSVFLFLVIFHHSAISIRLCSNFNILQCGLGWAGQIFWFKHEVSILQYWVLRLYSGVVLQTCRTICSETINKFIHKDLHWWGVVKDISSISRFCGHKHTNLL